MKILDGFIFLVSKGSPLGALFVAILLYFGAADLIAHCTNPWAKWTLLSAFLIYWPTFCFGINARYERKRGYLAFIGLVCLSIVTIGTTLNLFSGAFSLALIFGWITGHGESEEAQRKQFTTKLP